MILRTNSQLAVRWYFLRGLAVLSFLAFLSLDGQILGLVGQEGILPIAPAIEGAGVESAWDGFFGQPALVWFFNSDLALRAMTLGGIILSVLLFLDVFPKLLLLLLWFDYLSLTVAGRLFLSYQWDMLLLETLFVSIFFAPGNIVPGGERQEPTNLSVFLLRVVFFKLMFLGGVAKLLSGERNLVGTHGPAVSF
ncbi:MAG: lipase maturation factor family protein [bacterium]